MDYKHIEETGYTKLKLFLNILELTSVVPGNDTFRLVFECVGPHNLALLTYNYPFAATMRSYFSIAKPFHCQLHFLFYKDAYRFPMDNLPLNLNILRKEVL